MKAGDIRLKNLSTAAGLKTQFTSEKQPSGELKSRGKRQKKALKELLGLALKGNDKLSNELRNIMADFLKITPEEVGDMTIEEIMDLRQIHRALSSKTGHDWERIHRSIYGEKYNVEANKKSIIRVIIEKP